MIPVAQLDTASLALWFDGSLVIRSAEGPELQEILNAALGGDIREVSSVLDGMDDASARVRYAHLASTIWHEHRHFLDLVLTNYGAFRFRQFLSLYGNIGAVIRAAERHGELFCPLSAYADPILRRVHGLEPDRDIVEVAKDMRVRSEMAQDDRRTLPTDYGEMEIGGEAQLEALAFLSQMVALDHHCGWGTAQHVMEDMPAVANGHMRYQWASYMAADLGLAPVEKVSEQALRLNVTQLVPILFGSLACRRWGQEQTESDTSASGFASTRLAGFVRALRGSAQETTTLEAWHKVNEVAADLWGRSVLEEMREDYALEEKHMVDAYDGDTAGGALANRLARDFHALRGRMLTLLERAPEGVLDVDHFVEGVLPLLRPCPIIATPHGKDLPVPESEVQVLGFRDPDDDDAKWAWATAPATWPWGDPDVIALGDREAWHETFEKLGPLAKLLLHGRSHRTMIGPELMRAQSLVEIDWGIRVRYDPLFAFPDDVEAADSWFYLTAQREARCDMCRQPVLPDAGTMVGPWVFRKDEGLAEAVAGMMGEGEDGRRRFLRDWSAWVLCDRCAGMLEDGGFITRA